MRSTLIAVAGAAALAATTGADAELAIIAAGKDNTIYDEGGTSNGAGDYLFAGETAAQRLRRGLMWFDVAASVPSGATITDVTLTLHMSRTVGGAHDVAMHRLLQDWGEGASDAPNEEGSGAPAEPGDATWGFAFFDSDPWTDGGNFDADASATSLIGDIGFYDWSSDQLIADVQSFLDDAGTNFGWALIGNEQSTATSKRFDSRTNPNTAFRPELQVTYATPTPGALPLLAMGLIGSRRRRRTLR